MGTILNISEKGCTFKELRPEAYDGLEALYRVASDAISNPRYLRAAPAPGNETVDTWGIEMFYYGITIGYKLARAHMREEGILRPLTEANSQTLGDFSEAEIGPEE